MCCCSMSVRRAQAQNWQCFIPHAHRRFLALRCFPVDGVHCFHFISFVLLYDSCGARWRQRTFHQHIFFVLNLARTDRLAVVFLLYLCNGISFVRLCFCAFFQARCLLKIHDAYKIVADGRTSVILCRANVFLTLHCHALFPQIKALFPDLMLQVLLIFLAFAFIFDRHCSFHLTKLLSLHLKLLKHNKWLLLHNLFPGNSLCVWMCG